MPNHLPRDKPVKSTPLLFNPEMIRACLDGRKRMTRRLVNPKHIDSATGLPVRFPYGQAGDEIWAKETWRPQEWDEATGIMRVGYTAGGVRFFGRDVVPDTWEIPQAALLGRNVSPLFMPRWASRFVRTLTRVRIERLQNITAADIIAEGAVLRPHIDENLGKCPVSAFDGKMYVDLISLWVAGWNSINFDRAPWSSNRWVWVLEW